MPKLSVIIPCFNNGKYLKEMLECCLQQSFHDWEVIIVDDCSTDGETQSIIKYFSQLDQRIKFFIRDRAPKGSVVCRNIGFLHSTGEYIIHFDADDLISETCFDHRVKFMDENIDCDYASFPAKMFLDGERIPQTTASPDFGYYKGNKDLLYYFFTNNYPFSVWCNIYRRKSIQNIFWDEKILIYTDLSYIISCVLAGLKHKFSSSLECDYFYRQFNKGTNMCATFVSDDKCKSTIYFFTKTLERLKELPNGQDLIFVFREFVILHYERLLKDNNKTHIIEYISFCDKYYNMHKRMRFISYLSSLFKFNKKIQKGIIYLNFYILFGYNTYLKIILSRL